MVAGNVRPSSSSTEAVVAFSTTWRLVRMYPSLLMMIPEPIPVVLPPKGENRSVVRRR